MPLKVSRSVDPPTPKTVLRLRKNGGSSGLGVLKVFVDIVDVYLEPHADAGNALRTPEFVPALCSQADKNIDKLHPRQAPTCPRKASLRSLAKSAHATQPLHCCRHILECERRDKSRRLPQPPRSHRSLPTQLTSAQHPGSDAAPVLAEGQARGAAAILRRAAPKGAVSCIRLFAGIVTPTRSVHEAYLFLFGGHSTPRGSIELVEAALVLHGAEGNTLHSTVDVFGHD